jgi:hypothetical protein
MNRRDMLRVLLGSVAASATLDLERLLWVPGQMIAVPAMPRVMPPVGGPFGHTWALDSVLKDIYEDAIAEQVNAEGPDLRDYMRPETQARLLHHL